jgi:hypothetical protein
MSVPPTHNSCQNTRMPKELLQDPHPVCRPLLLLNSSAMHGAKRAHVAGSTRISRAPYDTVLVIVPQTVKVDA